jgi:hypothetical protein
MSFIDLGITMSIMGNTKATFESEIFYELSVASPLSKYCVGDFVIVFYTGDGSHYPGKIVHIGPVGATVSAMERSGNAWKLPKKQDELRYEFYHIRKIIKLLFIESN